MRAFAAMLSISLSFALLPCFAGTKGDAKRGKRIFSDLQCAICHTDGGNNLNPERPLKGAKFVQRLPDDKTLGATIRQGFPAKGMPANGKDKMSDQDLADVISYIRSLTPTSVKKKSK